jgi:MYXO-CTERM domain-containing protein
VAALAARERRKTLKRTALICLSLAVCAGAFGQVQIYNNINGSLDNAILDVDGGSNEYVNNLGCQLGQVITDGAGGSTITNVESYFVGYDSTSLATDLFVEVFNVSGGTVGSLVGSENVSVASENDSVVSSGPLARLDLYDLDANVNIGGLVAGQQYLVTMQPVTAAGTFQCVSYDASPDTYIRDFSQYGYPGSYGDPDWIEIGAYTHNSAYESDAVMKIEATPEPISLGVLGFGALALLRRRRASAS